LLCRALRAILVGRTSCRVMTAEEWVATDLLGAAGS